MISGLLPSTPSNLIAVADTFSVDLSWDDNSDNELGFKIERKDDSLHIPAPWVLIDSVVANATTFTDTGLTPGTAYSYRIYAYNDFGNSAYSDSVETVTFVPVELTSFTAIVNGSGVELNWTTATETNNRGFDVERSKRSNVNSQMDWKMIAYVGGFGTTTESKTYSFIDDKLFAGKYKYRLKQIDFDGTFSYSNEIEVEVSSPEEFALHQNYPNPFNPTTMISWDLAVNSHVTIKVYDVLGQVVATLINKNFDVGFHNLEFNAVNLNSGVYFYTIEAKGKNGENFVSTKKMMVIK
jgi:hypothetical protein